MTKVHKLTATLATAALLTSTVAPYASAATYEMREVYAQIDGVTYTFPSADLGNLLAAGKDVTHIKTNTNHVVTMKDYGYELAKHGKWSVDRILGKLIKNDKYLSNDEINRLQVRYGAKVNVNKVDGSIHVTVPTTPTPSQPTIYLTNITALQDVNNAVSVRITANDMNVASRIDGKWIELRNGNERVRLMYSGGGIYQDEAIFRTIDGKPLKNNTTYSVHVVDHWAQSWVSSLTVQNESPYFAKMTTDDTAIQPTADNEIEKLLTYYGVDQYNNRIDLLPSTKVESVMINGKTTTNFAYSNGQLTLRDKVVPKDKIEVTFTYKVKNKTERQTFVTDVEEFAPVKATQLSLTIAQQQAYRENDEVEMNVAVLDQYGKPMTGQIVEWQVGSQLKTGTQEETFVLKDNGKVTITVKVGDLTTTETIDVLAAPIVDKVMIEYDDKIKYFNGDPIALTAKVLDQHGIEMKGLTVDWQVGSLERKGATQKETFTLADEGKVAIAITINGKTETRELQVEPTPSLSKIQTSLVTFAEGDVGYHYEPIEFRNTKDVMLKPKEIDITKLTATAPTTPASTADVDIVYVKKSGANYEEVSQNEATHIALKFDQTKYQQGEHIGGEIIAAPGTSDNKAEVKGTYKLQVSEPRRLATMTIEPQSGVIGINDTMTLKVNTLDQYGRPFEAALSAKAIPTSVLEIVSKDGKVVTPIYKNNKISHYEVIATGLKKGKGRVEVSSGDISAVANLEVALAEITEVKPTSAHTLDVVFNRTVSKLTPEMVQVEGAKATLQVKRVELAADGRSAKITLRDRMEPSERYQLGITLGEDTINKDFTYKVGNVKSIDIKNQTVIQGRKLDYRVLDEAGVDITEDVELSVSSEYANAFVTGKGFIRLAATATGKMPITLTAGNGVKKTVTITAESSIAAPRKLGEYWTVSTTEGILTKTEYESPTFAQDELITEKELDKYLNLSVRDQFEQDVDMTDLKVVYESNAPSVLLVDQITGKLTPKATGTATITAKLVDQNDNPVLNHEGREITERIRLRVQSEAVLNEIVLSMEQMALVQGVEGFDKDKVTVLGKNQFGEPFALDDSKIQVKVGDDNIATATVQNSDVNITAVSEGETTVTVEYEGHQQTVKVGVKKPQADAEHYAFFNVEDLYFVEEEGKPTSFTPVIYGVDKNGLPTKKATAPIQLNGKPLTGEVKSEDLRKLDETHFTLSATVDGEVVTAEFDIMDNRKKPSVTIIDNQLLAKPGDALDKILLRQLMLVDGHSKPITAIEQLKFDSTNSGVIASNSNQAIKGKHGDYGTLYIASFVVKDSKGETFEIDMDDEPFVVKVDTKAPEMTDVTSVVQATEQAAFNYNANGLTFEAVAKGVEGNGKEVELKYADKGQDYVPTKVEVKGQRVVVTVGYSTVNQDIVYATEREVGIAVNTDEEASKIMRASSSTPETPVNLNGVSGHRTLAGGKSEVQQLTITYSKALDMAGLGDFSIDGTKATKVTPAGDNNIIILTFEPSKEVGMTATLATPKVKDTVGNEQAATSTTLHMQNGKLLLKP